MSTNGLKITAQQLRAGFEPALHRFNERAENEHIDAQLSRLVDVDGEVSAFFAPSVQFILGATLELLTIDEVYPQLSKEVGDKSWSAVYVAQEVLTRIVVGTQRLRSSYRRRDIGNVKNISTHDWAGLGDDVYIGSISAAPLTDAAVIMGGASQKLSSEGVEKGEVAQIVKDSKGLLAFSGIDKGFAMDAHDALGAPYASKDRFVLVEDEKGIRLRFSPEMQEVIRSCSVSATGCPAGKVTVEPGTGKTLLEEYWDRIADYYLPKDHTVYGE